MSNVIQKQTNAKVELKRGVSKKSGKSFYIFDIQLYDDDEKEYFPFKVDFLNDNEARLARKCGYPLTTLESKEIDEDKIEKNPVE